MSSGCALYLAVCSAADPKAEIAGLAAADLCALHDHVVKLPKDGVPGVIRAAVTLEAAGRWFSGLNAGGLP